MSDKRQYMYRGMTIGGEWVEGNLSIVDNKFHDGPEPGYYISNSKGLPFAYQVRPETVVSCNPEIDRLQQQLQQAQAELTTVQVNLVHANGTVMRLEKERDSARAQVAVKDETLRAIAAWEYAESQAGIQTAAKDACKALNTTPADAYEHVQRMQGVCEAGADYVRVCRVEDDVREFEQGRPSFIDIGNSRQEAYWQLEKAVDDLAALKGGSHDA